MAVHEIAVHPTAGEIVAATHGRGIWIMDATTLRQVTADTVQANPTLYKPNTVTRYTQQPQHGRTNRAYIGVNPAANTANIYYSLPKQAEKAVHDELGEIASTVGLSLLCELTKGVGRQDPVEELLTSGSERVERIVVLL